MKRTIQTQFEAGAIKAKVLLLEKNTEEISKIPEEVNKLASKFEDFGIGNSTATLIKEAKQKRSDKAEERQRTIVKDSGLQLLIEMFFPFKIISFKTIHEVAGDYNLIYSSLSYYNKPIAFENLEDLQIFKDLMVENKEKLSGISFPKGSSFSFDNSKNGDVYDIDFTNYFNIVAPKSHFDFKGDNTLQIGREIKRFEKAPGFKFKFKVSIPEPKDPIIVAPFDFLGKAYGFVVTAWDEVADDRRIRQMI